MIKNMFRLLLCIAAFFLFAAMENANGVAAQDPGCTNADCPPDPGCTNADCPPDPGCTNEDCPPDPGCTNEDCPPPEPQGDCCCVGPNLPGTTRVCCCRSADQKTVTCRESLVLTPESHETLKEATMDGFRPKGCDIRLNKLCNPPMEEVCKREKGKRVCKLVVKSVCAAQLKVCQYRFCGPEWFPFEEPAPAKASCGWWDQVRDCHRPGICLPAEGK